MARPATLDEFLRQEGSRDGAAAPSFPRRPPGLEPQDDPGVAAPEGSSRPVECLLEEVPPRWQCLRCDGLSFMWDDGWRCSGCGSRDFFNAVAPTTRHVGFGTWVYVPRGEPNLDADQTSSSSSLPGMPSTRQASPVSAWQPRGGRLQHRFPPDFSGGLGEARENAESESLTSDATIDPDTWQPAPPRPSRRQRRAAAAAAAAAGHGGRDGQGRRSPQVPRSPRSCR